MPLTLWTGFRTCQLEMGIRLRILWFAHISLQIIFPLTPALLCPPGRAGVSTEQGGAGEWSEVEYAESNMRKSACPPLLPIRAREVIVFLKTKPRTRAAQGRCAVPGDQVDQRYQQIQRRRSLDQHSLVTMWRGSLCTTL